MIDTRRPGFKLGTGQRERKREERERERERESVLCVCVWERERERERERVCVCVRERERPNRTTHVSARVVEFITESGPRRITEVSENPNDIPRLYSEEKSIVVHIGLLLLLAVRIHSYGCWFCSLEQVSIPKFWCWRLHISETRRTTETSFAPFGSATIALGHSENRTRISFTVSEIFDRKNSPERGYFFILILLISFRRSGQHSAYYDHVTPPCGEG